MLKTTQKSLIRKMDELWNISQNGTQVTDKKTHSADKCNNMDESQKQWVKSQTAKNTKLGWYYYYS